MFIANEELREMSTYSVVDIEPETARVRSYVHISGFTYGIYYYVYIENCFVLSSSVNIYEEYDDSDLFTYRVTVTEERLDDGTYVITEDREKIES